MVALPRDPSELPPPPRDGLLTHPSKPHSQQKLYYWSRVLQEVATRTKRRWIGNRVCLDLFASCGVCENTKTPELWWGSPMLALHAIDPFDVYIFGDKDPQRAAVLADRIDESRLTAAPVTRINVTDPTDPSAMRTARRFKALAVGGPKCAVLTGDANLAVPVVKAMMPRFNGGRIVLTMLDPYGASFRWDSLGMLTLHERMDLLMYFPEDVDLERNWRDVQRLGLYMPAGVDWQTEVIGARNRGRSFREIYQRGLEQQMNLKVGVPQPIRAGGRDIYKLLYASRHEQGLEVWEHARREDPGGQLEFYLA